MMNVGEALQLTQKRHLYLNAVFAQIIAQEIYNHHIFGAIFFALLEPARIFFIFLERRSALDRTFYRFCFDVAIFYVDKTFRGSTYYPRISELHTTRERRR